MQVNFREEEKKEKQAFPQSTQARLAEVSHPTPPMEAGYGRVIASGAKQAHGSAEAGLIEAAPAQRDISFDDLDKFRYYTIGPACAFCCRLMLFPFALVKTRLQMQRGTPHIATTTAKATSTAADVIRYSGTVDAFGKILRQEGPRGLFKGFGVSCVGIVSGQLYITTYELVRQEAKRMNDVHMVFSTTSMDVVRNAVAGGTASLLGQTLVVPVDILSQRQMMMSKDRTPMSIAQLSRDIFRREGVIGFYRGFAASVMVYAPSSSIWWGSYGLFRRKLQEYSSLAGLEADKTILQATAGATAGIVATLSTNPIDVARTRLQLEAREGGGVQRTATLRSMLSALWKEDGPRALMKGVQPRLMATVPSSIMIISVYEFVKESSVRK